MPATDGVNHLSRSGDSCMVAAIGHASRVDSRPMLWWDTTTAVQLTSNRGNHEEASDQGGRPGDVRAIQPVCPIWGHDLHFRTAALRRGLRLEAAGRSRQGTTDPAVPGHSF